MGMGLYEAAFATLTQLDHRSHLEDGYVVEAVYALGDTRHFVYGRGEYKIDDLENVGDAHLCFTTVEFLDSANEPLDINAGLE